MKALNPLNPLMLTAVALTLATAAVMPSSAHAQVGFNVNIQSGPPPAPRYEPVPVARHGRIWAPGYWAWNGHQHVWMRGHWEHVRPGYVYANPQWRQAHGGWYMEQGGWRQGGWHGGPPPHAGRGPGGPNGDRDHDGVPNYADRRPNNPYRY